jgi:dsDNA-specific endonuclease/ATPase MutS2
MNKFIKSGFAFGAGLLLLAGCEKKEATVPVQEPPKAAASQPADMGAMMEKTTNAAMQVGNEVTNAVTNIQQEADKAAAKAQEQATQAVDTLKKETNSLLNSLTDKTNAVSSIADSATKVIEAAKKLTGENKYDEALKMLGTLASSKLTPDQQKMVDSLKEQIQKAMAVKATDSATKAVGDLLKK